MLYIHHRLQRDTGHHAENRQTKMTRPTNRAEEAVADMAADCLAMRGRLIGRTVTGIYDDALRPVGITVGQLNILAVVVRLGPVSPGAVARRLHIERSTMSRNVERMKRNGWLEVRPGESATSQELRVTKAGRRVIEEAEPLWREAQGRARDILGAGGAEAIHRVGDAIRERGAG